MYGWVWAQFAPNNRAVAFERIAMKDFVISLLAATARGIGLARAQSAIERLDPALDALLAPIVGSRKSTRMTNSSKALPGTTGAQEAFSPAGRCSPYQRLPEREARIARRHSRGTKWYRFFVPDEWFSMSTTSARRRACATTWPTTARSPMAESSLTRIAIQGPAILTV
jgi:hypothetical protein